MFKLISTLTARPARPLPLVLNAAAPALGDRAFDHHVCAWDDHLEDRYLAKYPPVDMAKKLTWMFECRRDAQRTQEIWHDMADWECLFVIDELDRLDASGKLGKLQNHRFFEQWRSIRRRGAGLG